MTNLSRIAALLVLAGCVRARTPELVPDLSLTGRRFSGPLDGSPATQVRLVNTGGAVEYALHDVLTMHGRRLVLTRLLGFDRENRPEYEVRAALALPRLRSDDVVIMGACLLQGVRDEDVVVLARRVRGEGPRRVRGAWRANGEAATLAAIPLDGIVCERDV